MGEKAERDSRPENGSVLNGAASFRCESSRVDGRVVISVHGELDLATAPVLMNELDAMTDPGPTDLVLDLEGLEFIDSSGLAVVLAACRDASRRDMTFRVASVPDQARRVFEVAGLAETLGLNHP